jgi:hypothetical protein
MENLDQLDPEELEVIDSNNGYIKLSVLLGFVIGLFPQYTLLSHPYLRNFRVNGPMSKLGVIMVIPIPLITANIFATYFTGIQEEYIETLILKYSKEKVEKVS